MIEFTKKNSPYKLFYHSADYKSGQTVTADVSDPTDSAVIGSPFTLTEIGSTGVYTATFTPLLLGIYLITFTEEGLKSASTTVQSVDNDLDTLGTKVDSIVVISGASTGGYSP